MLYQNLRIFSNYLRLIDAGILIVGPLLARRMSFPQHAWDSVGTRALWEFLAALAITFILIARRLRIYHVRRGETVWLELRALLEASLLSFGAACLVVELAFDGLPRATYLTLLVSGTTLLIGTRAVVRALVRRLRTRGRDYRRWLLVGRNARSARIAQETIENPHFGIRIVAVVDSPHTPSNDVGGHGVEDPGAPFRVEPLVSLRQHEDLSPEFLRHLIVQEAVDEVVIALPLRRFYDEIGQFITMCGEAGIPVKMPTRTFEFGPDHNEIVHVGTEPLVTHYSGPVRTKGLTAKRVLDIVVSAPALILAVPFGLLIALVIKLTSPGPAFFRQTRIGLHSRPFRIIKFRTMIDGAAEQQDALRGMSVTDGPAFKMEDDPRITRVGRLLRRYHLDELPQLIHVLLGDMSLVGPRPLPAHEANGSAWWQRRRLSMPPGLTCLWQVEHDHRMSFHDWMKLDLLYIDRWSFWLDVQLLFKTVGTVFRGRGW